MLDTLHAVAERLAYYLRIPLIWAGQFLHDLHGILHVLDIIHFRPLRPGLLPADHPWLTGLEPSCQTPIWPKNILFRSPKPGAGTDAAGLPEDEAIVTRVGQFLAGMVARSVPTPEIPQGPRRRMPHGINYIHGAVHHSRWQPETDSNLGSVLSLWDRLFGTLRLTENARQIHFGLDAFDGAEHQKLSGLLRTPFSAPLASNGSKASRASQAPDA